MTPQMTLVALLLMVAVSSVVSTEDFDEEYDSDFEEEFGRGRKGFSCTKMGGVCFDATHFNVSAIVKEQGYCDNFVGGSEDYDYGHDLTNHRHICPHIHPYCCVNCETTQQESFCSRKVKRGSIPRRKCCEAEGELFFGSARLGCECCKKCKRRPLCRLRHGICVNDLDPVFNVTACEAGFPNTPHAGEYRIKKRGCVGIGCFCCEPLNPSNTTTASPANDY